MKINYLEEDLIAKLSQLQIKSFSLAEGIYKGRHQSKKTGEEIEFKEFRKYIRGDDFKKIDWKLSARQDRFFVKEFAKEFNYKVHLIVDQSSSMGDPTISDHNKMEYAKYITAALAYVFLKQGDQVQISSFAKQFSTFFHFSNTIQHIPSLINSLNKIKPKSQSHFSLLTNNILSEPTDKIIVFIISDFIYELNELITICSNISSPKRQIILVHLMNQEELNFQFKGEIHFQDPETGNTLFCHASQIKETFLSLWQNFSNTLQRSMLEIGISYNKFDTSIHYSDHLIDFIKLSRVKL